MADTRSPLLDLLLMETGGQDNTWGDSHNDEVTLLIEQAIAGYESIAVDGGTDTLTTDQARNAFLRFTGTLASNQIIQVPELSKSWLVYVGVTGAFDFTFRVGAAGATVTLRQGGYHAVWTDGTNIYAGPSSANFDTQLRAPGGSASVPGLAGLNDTDTGLEWAGSDVLYFVTGGTRRMRIEADGDIRAANGDELWLTLGATAFGESLVNAADAAATRTLLGLGTASLRDSPGTTVDNTVPRFDGVTGNFQTSGIVISDDNDLSGIRNLTITGAFSATSLKAAVASVRNLKIDNGDSGGSNLTNRVYIQADEAILADTNGNKVLLQNIAEVVNFTTTGAGGLQTGSLTNNNGYNIYLIYNSTTLDVAGFAQVDSGGLTLPSGYDFAVRVGWMPTNGSAQLYRVRIRGNRAHYINSSGLRAIGTGAEGSASTPTWVEKTIVQFVPPTAIQIGLLCQGRGGSASLHIVAPNSSYGNNADNTNPPPVLLSASNNVSVWFGIEGTSIYRAASGSGSDNTGVFCMGWVDNVVAA